MTVKLPECVTSGVYDSQVYVMDVLWQCLNTIIVFMFAPTLCVNCICRSYGLVLITSQTCVVPD